MNRKQGIAGHKLPTCRTTGLDRYRDRHQARHGAEAYSTNGRCVRPTSFACPDCRGFHLEELPQRHLRLTSPTSRTPTPASSPARFILVDIENLTAGSATRREATSLWNLLAQEAPHITINDHVVIGANRYVATKLSTSITGRNITWVVGANCPDGADHALLMALNLHQIAKKYDELVIMSGDHAFAELANRAKDFGLRVHVVTTTTQARQQRSSLSRQLAAAADQTTEVRVWTARPGHQIPAA